MSVPTYPSYVDSGVEWLGEAPSHWAPTRLRFLAQLNPSKTEVSEFDPETEVSFVPMEAVDERGELSLDQTRPLSEVLTGYTYFREGDVSIAKITPCFENGKGAIMRGLLGGVGFGTTEFIVARARPDATTPKFLDWLFRSPAFRTRGEAAMYGAGGQKRVPDNFVRDFVSPGAPFNEQVAIADFLDRETDKIDALIKEQRSLIGLLKEKRRAVIFHAVTKGLNPDAAMKDSNIEWLGRVPAHWEVRPLKYLISLRSGGTPSKAREDFWDGSIPWASAKDLKSERLSDTIDHLTETAITEGGVELNPAGSILILVRGMMLARAFPVVEILVPMAINQDLKAILPRSGMSSHFLVWAFRGTAQESLDRCSEAGHGTKALRMEDWLSMPFPCPPKDEQENLAAFLDQRARLVDQLIATADHAIELLVERRAALISAAVAGKIDVRASAKVLPFLIERVRARGLVAAEIIERSAHQATFGRVKLQKIAYLAEAYIGVHELAGSYTREAAGPLDRAMIDEMESGAQSIAGVTVDQAGGTGTTVSYRLGQQRGAHRKELADWLGADRTAKLDKLIADFAALTTKGAEAVATLYGVWNDGLIEGASPTDDDIISGFLADWHPEKAKKFRADELPEWLGWMRRHGIVPTGTGPKTATGRLFA